jgi:MoxR-like ATPase
VRRLHGYLAHSFPFATRLDLPGRGRALHEVWSHSDAAVLAYMAVDLSTDLTALLPLGTSGSTAIASWVERTVTATTVGGVTVYDLSPLTPRLGSVARISGSTDREVSVTEQDDRPPLSAAEVSDRLEQALFEIRRVIAGQDAMLERVLVCLLAQGHLLIEGVPGLAKTLTIKTTAGVLGGSFSRIQFTPDLVPADLVGTRIYRPDEGSFDTELGPVFCNFLLADEINRAPAKVQSALLEVMQERHVTIAHTTHPVPDPFLVMATQNPIESEGTYPLPEAQVDRFMLKILIGYPEHDEELTIVQRQLGAAPELREVLSLDELRRLQSSVLDVYVDPALVSYAVALASATRNPVSAGLTDLGGYIEYGASPRGPISVTQAARALALLRGRDYVTAGDIRALAKDALRHRLVLSYTALAEHVTEDAILDRVIAAVPVPEVSPARPAVA